MRNGLTKLFNFQSFMVLWLLSMCIYYGYQNLLPLEVTSIHHWRQSDCAVFAWNYYQTTANFLEPHFTNLLWRGDGKVAVEFPIIYYVVGMLYRVFGYHPWIFRTINTLIVLAGLFLFSQMIARYLRDKFWAFIAVSFLFTSPILVFYTNNFLPDMPALGMCLIGWYYFLEYYHKGKPKHFQWALWWMVLATLLKASQGISLVAMMALYFIEWNDWFRFKGEERIFRPQRWKFAAFFALGGLLIFAWYYYATWYSTRFETHHFSHLVKNNNIIRLLSNHFHYTFYTLVHLHGKTAFQPFMHLVILFLTFMGLGYKGQVHKLLFAITLLLFMGTILYLLLFFKLFDSHDYYATPMLIYPAWLFVLVGKILKEKYPSLFRSFVFKALLIGFLGYNIYQTKMFMQYRYYGNKYHEHEKVEFYEPGLHTFLKEKGVAPDAKVISLPDPSPNNTLHLLRRKGWSGMNVPNIPKDIQNLRNAGADYLILHDDKVLHDPAFHPFTQDTVGNYGRIWVFKL